MIRWVIMIGSIVMVIGYIAVTHNRLKSDDLIMLTVPRVHSYLSTESYKIFDVDFIISDPDAIYTLEEAYESFTLITGEQELSLQLKALNPRGSTKMNGQTMYQFVLTLRIPIHTDNISLKDEQAIMKAALTNQETITFDLGSFAYHVINPKDSQLSLNHVHNIAGQHNVGVTSEGMMIAFENNYDDTVMIESITLLNDAVTIDNHLITSSDATFSLDLKIETLIDETNIGEAIIRPGESEQFAVKFHFNNPTLLYRYPIVIDYRVNDTVKQYVIEDFLFINTNPYTEKNAPLFKDVIIDD